MSKDSAPPDPALRSEVVAIVQQLTTEVLLRRPDNVYDCCALYLERLVRLRDAKKLVPLKRVDDRKLIKLRMTTKASQSELDADSSASSSRESFHTIDETGRSPSTNRRKHAANQALSNVTAYKPAVTLPEIAGPGSKKRSGQARSGSFDNNQTAKKLASQDKISLSDSEKDIKKRASSAVSHGSVDIRHLREFAKPPLRHANTAQSMDRVPQSRASSASSDASSGLDHVAVWNGANRVSIGSLGGPPATDDDLSVSSFNTRTTTLTPLDTPNVKYDKHVVSTKSSGYSSDGESSRGSLWTPTKELTCHSDCVTVFRGHRDAVTHCHIVADRFVLSSSLDTTVIVWELKSGKRLKTLKCLNAVHDFQYVCVESKGLLLAGLEDGKITAWKVLEQGELVCQHVGDYSGHLPNPIRAMAVSPDLSRLATGCCFVMTHLSGRRRYMEAVRGTLKVWDLDDIISDCLKAQAHTKDKGPVNMKTMHQIVAGYNHRNKSPGSNETKFIVPRTVEKSWGVRSLVYAPSGDQIVVGFGHPDDEAVQDDAMLVICDAATLDTIWVEPSATYQVNYADCNELENDANSVSWEMITSTQRAIQKMTLSCLGRNRVDVIYQWSKETESDHFGGRVSPGGTVIASGVGSTLTFWDTYSGKVLKEIPAHKEDITRLCFSEDGKLVCTASDDHSLRLWRVPNIPKWTYVRSGADISGNEEDFRGKSNGDIRNRLNAMPGGSGLTYAHVHNDEVT